MKSHSSVPIALALFSAQAAAEWRCDCTTITDTCSASVTLQADFIEVTADDAQCARVDYFVEGLPFVSVVVDGRAREDWITRSADPRVIVQGCQVCRDNAAASAAAPASQQARPGADPQAATSTGPLVPLVSPQPAYPPGAQSRGLEGSVTVEFTVNPFGDVASPRVVAAEPTGVFDLAALSAVSRWRYPSDAEREPVTLRETVRFELSDYIWRTPAGAAAVPAAASVQSSGGPVNQCLRRNVSYNYGEMVEVGLIDACASPLVVFACAVGTGAVAERWVCSGSEAQSTVLVAPGDARIGSTVAIETGSVVRQYRYTDNFFIARAPNTEYWWIACEASDSACRDEARRWSGGLDRHTASIDPRQRTRSELGRSY